MKKCPPLCHWLVTTESKRCAAALSVGFPLFSSSHFKTRIYNFDLPDFRVEEALNQSEMEQWVFWLTGFAPEFPEELEGCRCLYIRGGLCWDQDSWSEQEWDWRIMINRLEALNWKSRQKKNPLLLLDSVFFSSPSFFSSTTLRFRWPLMKCLLCFVEFIAAVKKMHFTKTTCCCEAAPFATQRRPSGLSFMQVRRLKKEMKRQKKIVVWCLSELCIVFLQGTKPKPCSTTTARVTSAANWRDRWM